MVEHRLSEANLPRLDKTERDCVGTNTEGTPFLANGFGKTYNSRLCSSVISLSDIPMQPRGRRDVNDRAVFGTSL